MRQSLFTGKEPGSQRDPLAVGASVSRLVAYALALAGVALVVAIVALAVSFK